MLKNIMSISYVSKSYTFHIGMLRLLSCCCCWWYAGNQRYRFRFELCYVNSCQGQSVSIKFIFQLLTGLLAHLPMIQLFFYKKIILHFYQINNFNENFNMYVFLDNNSKYMPRRNYLVITTYTILFLHYLMVFIFIVMSVHS